MLVKSDGDEEDDSKVLIGINLHINPIGWSRSRSSGRVRAISIYTAHFALEAEKKERAIDMLSNVSQRVANYDVEDVKKWRI